VILAHNFYEFVIYSAIIGTQEATRGSAVCGLSDSSTARSV
jgi:hypothetical protein